MVTVEYRIPDGTRIVNTHIRAVGSRREGLALSVHLIVRGYTVLCIKEDGALIMNADQISNALGRLDNASRIRAEPSRAEAHTTSHGASVPHNAPQTL
jgi:hypothetical protein